MFLAVVTRGNLKVGEKFDAIELKNNILAFFGQNIKLYVRANVFLNLDVRINSIYN